MQLAFPWRVMVMFAPTAWTSHTSYLGKWVQSYTCSGSCPIFQGTNGYTNDPGTPQFFPVPKTKVFWAASKSRSEVEAVEAGPKPPKAAEAAVVTKSRPRPWT